MERDLLNSLTDGNNMEYDFRKFANMPNNTGQSSYHMGTTKFGTLCGPDGEDKVTREQLNGCNCTKAVVTQNHYTHQVQTKLNSDRRDIHKAMHTGYANNIRNNR